MTEPVTFNASAATIGTDRDNYLTGRTTDRQIRIDPIANTVEIIHHGGVVATFTNVEFIAGTSTSAHVAQAPSPTSVESLDMLLPGAASGFDYASYGVWHYENNWCVGAVCNFFHVAEALSIGILTDAGDLPPTGMGTYTGRMAGRFTDAGTSLGPDEFYGDAEVTADFSNGAVTGAFTNISITELSGGIDFNASMSGNNYSGSASGGGMQGPMTGSFYGPNAIETGGVFEISDGTQTAVGAFAAK